MVSSVPFICSTSIYQENTKNLIQSVFHVSKKLFKKRLRKPNSFYGDNMHDAPHVQVGILPIDVLRCKEKELTRKNGTPRLLHQKIIIRHWCNG
jgi:hypothetical protein